MNAATLQACYGKGCASEDLAAGLDAAAADGVDVITWAFYSTDRDRMDGIIQLATMNAGANVVHDRPQHYPPR